MGTRTSGFTACPSRDVFTVGSATNPSCHNCFVAFAGSGWDGLTPRCEWDSALVGMAQGLALLSVLDTGRSTGLCRSPQKPRTWYLDAAAHSWTCWCWLCKGPDSSCCMCSCCMIVPLLSLQNLHLAAVGTPSTEQAESRQEEMGRLRYRIIHIGMIHIYA